MTAIKAVNLAHFLVLIALYVTETIVSYMQHLKILYFYLLTLLKVDIYYLKDLKSCNNMKIKTFRYNSKKVHISLFLHVGVRSRKLLYVFVCLRMFP